jgi:outer membrane biosynthesis protein TonB
MPNPAYTKEALKAKFEGSVFTEAVVETDGKIGLRILKSPGLGLGKVSAEAMRTWKCKPAQLEGEFVVVRIAFALCCRLASRP